VTSFLDAFAPTIDELIKCAEREVEMRRRVYPRLVLKGKMKVSVSEREIALMEAIVVSLKRVRAKPVR
jgi:hypothetical protein